MTSDPDPEATARARLIALLSEMPRLSQRNPYRGGYAVNTADERLWRRSGEQERRRMLKDCGWL